MLRHEIGPCSLRQRVDTVLSLTIGELGDRAVQTLARM